MEGLKIKENVLNEICELYVKKSDAQALRALFIDLHPLFAVVPKTKTAKIVQIIAKHVTNVPNSGLLQLKLFKEQANWAKGKKHLFLSQRIDLHLAAVYLENREYQHALSITSSLISDVKKREDKMLLVDVYLLQSHIYNQLKNLPKAKSSLMAAKSNAHTVYLNRNAQAEIDIQSGLLDAIDKNFTTAYSHYCEAFKQFSSLEDSRALSCLKYMLMCKIMSDQAAQVPVIIQSKVGLKYLGQEVNSMTALALACQNYSIHRFQDCIVDYKSQLLDDPSVSTHLSSLYDTIFEKNLQKIVEPYSRVEVAFLASSVCMPQTLVEMKISQMVLDKSLQGVLNQKTGCLHIFPEEMIEDCDAETMREIFVIMSDAVQMLLSS
jgi:26S proteasome regulatory subunit N6